MATRSPRAESRSDALADPALAPSCGVDALGQPALPWLGAALADALALTRSHALLLHGPAGAGHLDLALLLAQTLLCDAHAAGQAPALACGRCRSCHLVSTRSHHDLRLELPELSWVQYGWASEAEVRERFRVRGETKLSRELKIDQVREAIAWSQQTSAQGRGKWLLLHPADALNAASASALLKTLEEPPRGLRIVLTCQDPERLLPTVRSRCQKLRLSLPEPAAARAWLQGRGVADPATLLAASSGSPLEACAWAALGLDAAALRALPGQVAAGQGVALAGLPLPRALELLLKLAHDAMRLAVGDTARFFPDAAWPARADLAALCDWQRVLLRTARHADHPWNAPLLIESLLSQARGCWPAYTRAA